nr:MAG TPA: hypothetical protein [Bacteriophage sp.]
MKITSAKRDDILKRKYEYEADRSSRQSKYDAQYRKYLEEDGRREEKIRNDVIGAIGETSLDLEIRVSGRFEHKYEISVSDENDKFNEDKALSWDWKVYLDKNGDVKKESSSWSGMNAVTAKNLSNLKEIVRVLEILNNIDFKMILEEIRPPRYQDYVTEKNPKYETAPDFDRELMEADIEDCIGTRKGILGTGSKFYRGNVYHFIQRETPSSYNMWDIPAYYVEKNDGSLSDLFEKYNDRGSNYNMRKDKFFETIEKPIKIVDFS